MPGPLDGLRVIDVGTRIGAPFCAGLLGEWGAEVVKVEQPRSGDFMRTIGPFADGYSLFWAVEGRGRKSATCDLRTPEGQDLFRRLADTADVVCENFRPGTLEDWGLGPATLSPHLVVVRISAFGQDGPYAERPGLDRLGVAYGGLLHLTGEADRPPVRPGVTVADYLTGVFAAEAALAALYRRDATPRRRGGAGREGAVGAPSGPGPAAAGGAGRAPTGTGAVVDASLYGSVLRILEWTIAAYDRLGTVRSREGNRLSNSAPLDNYPTSDGRFVCVVAGGDANFGRLCHAMGRPDLLSDPRYATLADRARHGDEINGVVASWTAARTAAEVEEACVRFDVPVATAYTAVEIAADAHFTARHDLVTVDDPVLGAIRQQAPYPRLVGETGATPVGAPTLGADNVEVWCEMVGLTAGELDGLQAQGIV
ncbi:MAG TPA: CoA transferase [Acidimicrobiales bacterium]|nr:CoA transferase [Acidimicrobiales bacterium]